MRRQTRAHKFAAKKHKGQKDDDGKRYIEAHIWKVAMAIRKLTDDDDVICAAFLHDTIEDTDTTYEELRIEFGKRVADLVNEVTHEGKADEYGFYFPRLKSPEAIMIKLVDRASNISRMDSWSEDRREHYIKKTRFWKDGEEDRSVIQKVIDVFEEWCNENEMANKSIRGLDVIEFENELKKVLNKK